MEKMNDCLFTIIISAYNREKSLETLLKSLSDADYNSKSVNLVISIDSNKYKNVIDIAMGFKWNYGIKKVVVHEEQKGLKNHFLWCGDQTYKVGPVLFLEEDMIVSKFFVNYVDEFLSYYSNDARVAGSSLYSIQYNEMITTNFIPVDDGSDVFFYQQAYWGKIYHPEKWNEFRLWYNKGVFDLSLLPINVQNWGDKSFKKFYILYLVTNNKYIVFPRRSLATNMGVAGLHASNLIEYQTPLLLGQKKWNFINFDESHSIYDAYQEIVPKIVKYFNPLLLNYDFDVDINGTKHILQCDYVLTMKKTKKYMLKFSYHLKPLISNVFHNIDGNSIFLVKNESNKIFRKISKKTRIRQMYLSLRTNNIINKKKLIIMTLISLFSRER